MSATNTKSPGIASLLWANSIALSWMWGLGLFYSVQFTIERGLLGTILWFAVPNAVGLFLFGLATQKIASRESGPESLARFFAKWSKQFRFALAAYQLLALALTFFAIVRYIVLPLAPQPALLFVALSMVVALAASCWLGEEFDIRRIKISHGVMGGIIALAIAWLIWEMTQIPTQGSPALTPVNSISQIAFLAPLFVGLLTGPWLDLQQWQRAIQIHREGLSITKAYAGGSLLFFGLLIFHACFSWWVLGQGAQSWLRPGAASYLYGHEIGVLFAGSAHSALLVAYLAFTGLCLLATLDSGYVASRWFVRDTVAEWKNPIIAMLPTNAISSPIPLLMLAAGIAVAGAYLSLELEYFMIFYGTFFVGYSVAGIALCREGKFSGRKLPGVQMFCLGAASLGIGGLGYFLREPWLMLAAALLPLTSLGFLRGQSSEAAETAPAQLPDTPSQAPAPITTQPLVPAVVGAGHSIRGHFEGKWFVTSFIVTYADTNSVGNVYFGMYAMWAGKTRELFFNHVMPDFNIENTSFYILTRSFEHKFVRETREFNEVCVKLRIGSYNRKFVTLEHEIHDVKAGLLGEGKQTLMFVASKDYKLIDLPPEIFSAFINYA